VALQRAVNHTASHYRRLKPSLLNAVTILCWSYMSCFLIRNDCPLHNCHLFTFAEAQNPCMPYNSQLTQVTLYLLLTMRE